MIPGEYVHGSMERFRVRAVSGESHIRFPNDGIQFNLARTLGPAKLGRKEQAWRIVIGL